MELDINQGYKEESSENIIKVIGIGGAGNNAVNDMYQRKVEGIDYIVCNTDIQDLTHSPVPRKLQIGVRLTEGLGAGSIPQSGKEAAEESEEAIREVLSGATRMVIIAAGMGGGTGTGGSPVVARIAQDMGLVVVSIVTTPFGFERQRLKEAIAGIETLEEVSDALLIINNQKLQRIYGDLSFPEACGKANEVLVMAAKSISEIVTQTAEQNIDYADLERMLRGSGMAVFGVGSAQGQKDRIGKAIEAALYSPLLDNCDITGAKSLLVNIVLGAENLSVEERRSIGDYMRRMAGRYREMKFGTRIDENLATDEVVITIVATNFTQERVLQNQQEQGKVTTPYTIEVEEKEEDKWLEVEDTQKIEERARKQRERKERQRRERLRVQQEAEHSAKEELEGKGELDSLVDTVGDSRKTQRPDPIEKLKRKRTGSTKRGGGLQGFLDFFGGHDVKDDVEM